MGPQRDGHNLVTEQQKYLCILIVYYLEILILDINAKKNDSTFVQKMSLQHYHKLKSMTRYCQNAPLCCVQLLSFSVAQLVKNLPAIQETPVQFLGQEDLLKKGQATHSNILGLSWWLRQLRIHLQYGRPGFDPLVGKIP